LLFAREAVLDAAREKEGKLDLAKKALRQATQTDPLNNEAWYYYYQVNVAIRDRNHQLRLWYPTLPPRPAQHSMIP
jgi:hypothetical protein